jgi:hypothetical protein
MSNIPRKFSTNGNNINDVNTSVDLISIGRVISIDDEYDGNRIKVRINGVDKAIADADLPYALPFMARFINIMPNVGETVLILTFKNDNKYQNRLWIGPIISQPQNLKNDPHFYSSTALFDGGVLAPKEAPSRLPNAKGIYPNKGDITIQGRENTDITQKVNEIVMRVGKHLPNDNLTFNKETIGYIQLKNNVVIKEATEKNKEEKGTVINMVANKINLISHQGNPKFVLNDQDSLITDQELKKILTETHPLVYGDKLIELLSLVKEFVTNHTHPYPGLPPVKDKKTLELLNFNLESIISQNIRIN